MKIVKILLGEGGDVKLGVRTSKHIFVFVFGFLSQFYSCYLLLLLIHICLILCLHLFQFKRAIKHPNS